MKKQLLLLISLLLPLISGCDEKPSETTNSESTQETINVYKESDYSKKLNNISFLIVTAYKTEDFMHWFHCVPLVYAFLWNYL